jgi:hypothetical protein
VTWCPFLNERAALATVQIVNLLGIDPDFFVIYITQGMRGRLKIPESLLVSADEVLEQRTDSDRANLGRFAAL